MKKYISTLLIFSLLCTVVPIVNAEYEDTEYFTTEVTYLKAGEYAQLKQNFTTIDISPYATAGYADEVAGDNKGGWTDEGSGNDMSEFTLTGRQVFKGIPFDLTDPKENDGKAAIILAGRGATFVPDSQDVPIGAKAAGLYILQCHAWNYGSGDKKGEYTLVYDDGTSATLELIEDVNIHNFWGAADYATFQNVWKANHPVGGQENAFGLFAMSNPYPDKVIDKLYMHSMDGGTRSWLMVMGITLTDSGPYLPDMGIVDLANPASGSWMKSDGEFSVEPGSALDNSFLLEKPAGKHGFVKASGDNFEFADGQRIRFWGVNISDTDILGDRSMADKSADDISRLGYNIVRICVDAANIDDKKADDIQYFFAKLKANGVYTYLGLTDGRAENIMLDEELISAQKSGMEKLIGAENPYTGIAIAKDAALAMLEFAPESGMYYLEPQVNSTVNRDELSRRFSQWLLSVYKNDAALKKAWNDGTGVGLNDYESAAQGTVVLDEFWKQNSLYSNARNVDVRKFFGALQTQYYDDMKAYATSLGFGGVSSCNSNPFMDMQKGDSYINSSFDFVARNCVKDYVKNGENLELPVYFTKNIESSLLSGGLGIISEISAHKFDGTPLVVSGWNSVWANQNYTEDYLLMAAYGARQNWNPIAYSYVSGNYADSDKLNSFYDIRSNYVSRAAQVSALFNALTEQSKKVIYVDDDDIYMDGYRPHHMLLKDNKIADMISRGRYDNFYKNSVSYAAKDGAAYSPAPPSNGVYKDDTVKTDTVSGSVYVIADSAEAYAGHGEPKQTAELKTIDLCMENYYYTAMLTSADGGSLDKSNMLLTLTASTKNKGYNLSNNFVSMAGKSPALIQPVQGKVTLKQRGDFEIYSLNYDGTRNSRVASYKNSDGYTCFNVNEYSYSNETRSLNFEIIRKRG